jgi:hypothetical protein
MEADLSEGKELCACIQALQGVSPSADACFKYWMVFAPDPSGTHVRKRNDVPSIGFRMDFELES